MGWGASTYRIFTWARLQSKGTGQIFTHYNTHLDHVGQVARKQGVGLLLDRIQEERSSVILTGGVNFLQDSPNYDQISRSGSLVDAKRVATSTMSHGTINWFLPLRFSAVKPIGFCFVSPDIQAVTYRVAPTQRLGYSPLSDHYPVIVDLVLPQVEAKVVR